jgi:hypothetical protein
MEFYPEVQRRWLVSVISGALAVITMFTVPVLGLMFGGPALLLAAFSGIGVLSGVLSFAAKEQKRKLAYVGLALSTAPWLVGLVSIVVQDPHP